MSVGLLTWLTAALIASSFYFLLVRFVFKDWFHHKFEHNYIFLAIDKAVATEVSYFT